MHREIQAHPGGKHMRLKIILFILLYNKTETNLEKNLGGGPIEKFKNKTYFGFHKT